ncbi:hypothetical protein [Gluconacetobacter entanii]|uniref:hypothetical protein n=1 Tax=Gluconacetobacter entanii TaxID=108528 RepID=UPI00142E36B0|nr:hypothetical protein [Gluconacetobacter entanii]MCE2578452.1 hypothetical protein [Komagataeibacter sp. FNDCR1]
MTDAVILPVGHALIPIAFDQLTDRDAVDGGGITKLAQIDLGPFFIEPASSQSG